MRRILQTFWEADDPAAYARQGVPTKLAAATRKGINET